LDEDLLPFGQFNRVVETIFCDCFSWCGFLSYGSCCSNLAIVYSCFGIVANGLSEFGHFFSCYPNGISWEFDFFTEIKIIAEIAVYLVFVNIRNVRNNQYRFLANMERMEFEEMENGVSADRE